MPDLRIAQSYGDSSNIDGFPGVAGDGIGLSLTDLNLTIGAYLANNGYNPGTTLGSGSGAGGDGATLSTSQPTTQAINDIPFGGTGLFAAREDHVHGMPNFGSVYPQLLNGLSPTDGITAQVARADHSHGTPIGVSFGAVVAEQTFGASSNDGTASTAARSDHHHGNPSDAPLVHLAGTEIITGQKSFNSPTTFNANITAPNIVYTVTANTGVASTGGQNPVITNTGVLSNAAGAGISINATTGNVTITNTGVLSLGVLNNATINAATGALTITNSLTPTYTTVTVNGPGTAFQVLNAASIGTTLTVTGAVTLNSTLSVVGTSTLAALNAQATTTTTLSASGNTQVTGSSTFTVGTGATALGGTLNVTGTSTLGALNSQVTTTTAFTANGTVMLNGNTSISAGYTLTVGTGATTLGGTLNVSGLSTLATLNAQGTTVTTLTANGVVTLNGNTSVTGANTFTVGTGLSSLGGNLSVMGNSSLTGTLTVAGATVINNTLNALATTVTTLHATGATTLDGNTNVTGSATFTVGVGATNLGGTLTVSAAALLNSTLHVVNTTTLDGNVSITGGSTFSVASGATSLGGFLTVSGGSTFNGPVTLNANTTVTSSNTFTTTSGQATFGGPTVTNGTLTANATSTFNANVFVTGTSSFTVVGGPSNLGGSLTVTGQSTFNDNVYITGSKTFTVGTGQSTLGGVLDVTGAVTNRSVLHQIGAATLDNTLSVGGDAQFLGNVTATQFGKQVTVGDITVVRTFTGNVIKSTNIIDGQVQANDLLTYPGYVEDGSFEVRNPATSTWTMTATDTTLGQWSITSDPATNVNAYNGSYYATHLGQTGIGATGTDTITNNATFPVTGGTLYFAQCQGKSSTGTNGTTTVVINFYDSKMQPIAAAVSTPSVLINGVNQYVPLYSTAVAPQGAVFGRIGATVTGKTIGQVYLDSFSGGPGTVIPNLSIDASQKLIDNTLGLKTFATNAIPDTKGVKRVFGPQSISAINLTHSNFTTLVEDGGFEQFPSNATTTWNITFTDLGETTAEANFQILLDQPHAHLGSAYLLRNPSFITATGGSGVQAHAHNNLKANCRYGDKFYAEANLAPLTQPPTGATGTNPTGLPPNGAPGIGWNYHDNQGQPTFVFAAAPTGGADGVYKLVYGTSIAPFNSTSVHFDCAVSGHTQGFWLWDDCTMAQQLPYNQQFAPNSIDGTLITNGAFDIPSSSVSMQGPFTTSGPVTMTSSLAVSGSFTAPNVVYGVTGSGNMASSGGQNPNITITATPTFTSATIPTLSGNVTFSGTTSHTGAATFSSTVAATGNVTAPNLVYSVAVGAGISTTGGQNPTLTNTGVLTVAGRSGSVSLTAADIGAGSFPGAITFASTTAHTGAATFSSTVGITGNLTAPNVVYSVGAGTGISSSGGQNPVLTNTGATSVAGRTGAVTLTAADIAAGTFPGAVSFASTVGITGNLTAPNVLYSATAGAGISITAGQTPTIANTGVTSIVAGTNVTISGATGAVTVNATVPVSSVAGRTGAVTLTAADVGAGTFPGAVTFASTVSVTGLLTASNGMSLTAGDVTTAVNAVQRVASDTDYHTMRWPSIAKLNANSRPTWDGSNLLAAAGRLFIILGAGNRNAPFTQGWHAVNFPAVGTVITGVGGQANVTTTAAGIPIPAWTTLYQQYTGGDSSANFFLAAYSTTYTVPKDWIMVATQSSDDGRLRLGSGDILDSWRAVSALGYTNLWADYGDANYKAQYKRVNNHVYLRGLIASGTLGQVAFTLPGGYRPNVAAELIFPANSIDAFCSIRINGSGQVKIINGSNTWVSLAGISFPADN